MAAHSAADQIEWPSHKASLEVSHNRHLSYYETVEQAIEHGTYDPESFVDAAEMAACIASGSVWEIHWYPKHPVTFNVVLASTLGRALAAAHAEEG